MRKIFSLKPFNAQLITFAGSSRPTQTHNSLAVAVEENATSLPSLSSVLSVPVADCGLAGLADSMLQNMWAKAERQVNSDGHIIRVPWSSDVYDWLVKSSTSTQSHVVTRDPKNKELYRSDQNCAMFKGFSIC